MCFLYLSSRTVFSNFCTLRLASSLILFQSAIPISYRTMLRVSRSSTKGILFIWTPWNWSALNPSILLMNIMNRLEVSSPSCWFLFKWRVREKKDSGCRYMAVSCPRQMLDSWFCNFSKVVSVRLRPCTP